MAETPPYYPAQAAYAFFLPLSSLYFLSFVNILISRERIRELDVDDSALQLPSTSYGNKHVGAGDPTSGASSLEPTTGHAKSERHLSSFGRKAGADGTARSQAIDIDLEVIRPTPTTVITDDKMQHYV